MKQILEQFESFRRKMIFPDKKENRRKAYSAIWAIIFGLIIVSVIFYLTKIIQNPSTAFNKLNPFWLFIHILKEPFDKLFNYPENKGILMYFIIFGFSGLAVSFGFKCGYFNIGGPGQMTLPAVVMFAIYLSINRNGEPLSMGFLLSMLFLSIFIGFMTAAISGVLKAFFRVHEVISTIFLNWIISFIAGWMILHKNKVFGEIESIGPSGLVVSVSNEISFNFMIIGIVAFILVALSIFFIYSRTTIGYKIKLVGLNPSNAQYVGINEKLMCVLVLGISGALNGIAGFFYFLFIENGISDKIVSQPILIAFDSIAISLLALNGPIGVIFTSFLYSFIYIAKDLLALVGGIRTVDSEFYKLVPSLILFLGAMSVMFLKFRPIKTLIKYSYLITQKEFWHKFKEFHQIIWKNRKDNWGRLMTLRVEHLKISSSVSKIRKEYDKYVDKMYQQAKQASTNEERLDIYNQMSIEKFNFYEKLQQLGINNYRDAKNVYLNNKHEAKKIYKAFKEEAYNSFISLINAKWTKMIGVN